MNDKKTVFFSLINYFILCTAPIIASAYIIPLKHFEYLRKRYFKIPIDYAIYTAVLLIIAGVLILSVALIAIKYAKSKSVTVILIIWLIIFAVIIVNAFIPFAITNKILIKIVVFLYDAKLIMLSLCGIGYYGLLLIKVLTVKKQQ